MATNSDVLQDSLVMCGNALGDACAASCWLGWGLTALGWAPVAVFAVVVVVIVVVVEAPLLAGL